MSITMTPRDSLERRRMHDAWADGAASTEYDFETGEIEVTLDNPYPLPETLADVVITGEGFRTLGIYRIFFTVELARQRKIVADYEAEVAEWYENGQGRSPEWVDEARCSHCGTVLDEITATTLDEVCDEEAGLIDHHWVIGTVNIGGLGHTFPHCIHGSSRWTDYDNICGGCEDSETVIGLARGYAREAFIRFNDRWDWVQSAPGDLDQDIRADLTKWALAPSPFGK